MYSSGLSASCLFPRISCVSTARNCEAEVVSGGRRHQQEVPKGHPPPQTSQTPPGPSSPAHTPRVPSELEHPGVQLGTPQLTQVKSRAPSEA